MFLTNDTTKHHMSQLQSLVAYRGLIAKADCAESVKASMLAKVNAEEERLKSICFEKKLADGRIHVRHPNFCAITTEFVDIDPTRLFGSFIKSEKVVRLKVFRMEAFVDEDGVAEYFKYGDPLAVADFTAYQFQSMVFGSSMGATTPCTLRHLYCVDVDAFQPDALSSLARSFSEDVAEDTERRISSTRKTLSQAEEGLSKPKKMSEKSKSESIRTINNSVANLKANSLFVSRQLAELAAKVTEQKRCEIELFFVPRNKKQIGEKR